MVNKGNMSIAILSEKYCLKVGLLRLVAKRYSRPTANFIVLDDFIKSTVSDYVFFDTRNYLFWCFKVQLLFYLR